MARASDLACLEHGGDTDVGDAHASSPHGDEDGREVWGAGLEDEREVVERWWRGKRNARVRQVGEERK